MKTKIIVKYDQVDFLKNTPHQKDMYFTIQPHPTTPILWIQYVLSELNGDNPFAGKLLFNLEDTWINQQEKAHEMYLRNMKITINHVFETMVFVPPIIDLQLRKTPLIGFGVFPSGQGFKSQLTIDDYRKEYGKYAYGTFTE